MVESHHRLLFLLIVDTLLFAGENYAKSKFIESILDGAKGVCHSAPPAAGEGGGGTGFPVSSADPPGSLLSDAAWNEMGDSTWEDVELSCRYASFATLTVFLFFELLAIFVCTPPHLPRARLSMFSSRPFRVYPRQPPTPKPRLFDHQVHGCASAFVSSMAPWHLHVLGC